MLIEFISKFDSFMDEHIKKNTETKNAAQEVTYPELFIKNLLNLWRKKFATKIV